MASMLGVNSGPWRGEWIPGQHHTAVAVSEAMLTEITARLVGRPFSIAARNDSIGANAVASFVRLALEGETEDLVAEIDRHLEAGNALEDLLVLLLAPAARIVGTGWETDELDFIDVTMALWRMQETLREVAGRSPHPRHSFPGRFALFSPMPGDQHSFGTAIIEECFARAGWDTDLLIQPSNADLLAAIGASHCDVVALTVSCDCHIEALPSLVAAMRSLSLNSHVKVLLGGQVLTGNPSLAREVGADGTAATATGALKLAEGLVELDYAPHPR